MCLKTMDLDILSVFRLHALLVVDSFNKMHHMDNFFDMKLIWGQTNWLQTLLIN